MLTSLRIQNFRSIRDASVKLGQVNLFIGPNNSGKSNFLKGMELMRDIIGRKEQISLLRFSEDDFNRILSKINSEQPKDRTITFNAVQDFEEGKEYKTQILFQNTGNKDSVEVVSSREYAYRMGSMLLQIIDAGTALPDIPRDLADLWKAVRVYRIDPTKFTDGAYISNTDFLAADGGNIVPFLFNLGQNRKNTYRKIERNLAECVATITGVSTPADPSEEGKGKIKLKFFDKEENDYWADEVSEGVLYFLALLCIVHQPDPPKLLLLEEPEKGIHPRRIKEVMDFIFELARLRDIQIILTSHSPYVVDHFKDIPECISVFDRVDGETVIHNAGDIIKETNDKLEAAGQKPIRYTDALGEYWVSGFLGGVPL